MTSSRRGLTVIELVIGIIILGILIALALPRVSTRTTNGHLTAMKSDLVKLVKAESLYFADSARFVGYDTTRLKFRPSSGVSAPTIVAGPGFWTAKVTHPQLPNVTCGVSINTLNPVVAKAGDAEAACR